MAGLLALAALFAQKGSAQSSFLPVVPGAWGFGMQTRAAYGCGSNPTVYRVTNRNDSGAGSLRHALTASGPRVVTFDVSGYINMDNEIYITSPCLTVAGQTAPSPGITLRATPDFGRGKAIFIQTHDVLLQHLRIRPGAGSCNSGIQIWGGSYYNIVLDHLSVSWAQDENISVSTNSRDVTVWRTISSEGLYRTPQSESCGGGGTANGHGLALGNVQRVAVLQNLLAHNLERTPHHGTPSSSYIANNVLYNAHEGHLYEQVLNGAILSTSIGNYIKRGPTSRADSFILSVGLLPGSRIYLSDNTINNGDLAPAIVPFQIVRNEGIDPRVGSPPIAAPTGYTPISSTEAYESVLVNVGARPADRDAVDSRTITAGRDCTGDIIRHPDDVDGYPPLAVNRRELTMPASPHTVTSSGYTNLEVWLQTLATAVERGITAPTALGTPTDLRIVD